MSLIYEDIKAGRPADPVKFQAVSEKLFAQGCDSIVLGCTELSLIKKATPPGPRVPGRPGGAGQALRTGLRRPAERRLSESDHLI